MYFFPYLLFPATLIVPSKRSLEGQINAIRRNPVENKTSWLANAFIWLGESFEKFNPAAFRFLAAILPYATPFPVAWLTMHSAESFLNFTPIVAFIFVFVLEGMGLWFTSLFVDSIIDFIRSRNMKTSILVLLFGLVVTGYVYLLVSLNVTLKASSGEANAELEKVITLLCFLPLLTGVGNGYYKWKLEENSKLVHREEKAEAKEEAIRHENNDLRLKKAMLKAGFNPLQIYASDIVSTTEPKQTTIKRGDWRLLTPDQRYEVVHKLTVPQIMEKYNLAESTAYLWKSKKL